MRSRLWPLVLLLVGCGEYGPLTSDGGRRAGTTDDAGGDGLPPSDAGNPHAAPDAGPSDGGTDGGAPDASAQSWVVPARPYLDGTATHLASAYGQDAWNQKMQGTSGGLIHPFFTASMFNCTDQSTATRRRLACPAALSEARPGPIRKVVLHNTLESLPDTVSIFHRNRPYFRTDRTYPVSIHYVVGRDGTVVEMVPESRVAYHAGGTSANSESVGIEIVANVANDPSRGHTAARTWSGAAQQAVLFSAEGMTIAQYRSLLLLVGKLMADHGLTASQVVSHRELSGATSCPGSIWRSGTTFSDWKSRDFVAHLQCAAHTGSDADFSRCLR